MELFTELLTSLLKTSPFIGLMMIAVYYLNKENKELKKENKELNTFIRDESIKNVKVLESVSSTLDKLIDKTDNSYESLKEWISLKLKERK